MATAAWERMSDLTHVGSPRDWFSEQAGLRGLETWPDAQGNLWALNGDPEEESADAHPGLTLATPLLHGEPARPSRTVVLALTAMDVLNQLGFEPDMPVSVVASSGDAIRLSDETARRVGSDTAALARQYGLTVYDAVYLELAMRRGATLATTDKALAKAATSAGVPLLFRAARASA